MGMQFARHDNKQDLDDGHDNKQDLNDAMLWQGASMEAISSGVGVLQRIDSYPSSRHTKHCSLGNRGDGPC